MRGGGAEGPIESGLDGTDTANPPGGTTMRHRLLAILVLVIVGVALGVMLPQGATGDPEEPPNQVLAEALAIERGDLEPPKHRLPLSGGVLFATLDASGQLTQAGGVPGEDIPSPAHAPPSTAGTQGCQNVFEAGGRKNTRVNQDCSLRRQAEEVVAINPRNPQNLIAGQNDSRLGFNHCGYGWSFDGGTTWGDQVPPLWGFIGAQGTTFDACADPTATFDADGNAYVGGLLFDVFTPASAVVVAKSNYPIGGAFYHSPDASDPFQTLQTNLGVIANDNDPTVFNDKEFIVADASRESPKRNTIYATWTRFDLKPDLGDGFFGISPIYFSQSTDGGTTWSAGIPISGVNPAICTAFFELANPGACDQDQGSHPIVGDDGTVYVVFANANTPLFGLNQVLFVKCKPESDCSDPSSWTAPIRVDDLIGTHPIDFGANVTGCRTFSQCLPPNGYRVSEITSMSVSVDRSGTLFVSWSDFRNGGLPANPDKPCATLDTETASPPCDNDVFYAYSTDGGASWSEAVNVTPAKRLGESAQWQPWSTITEDGRRLLISYYDRGHGDCEFEGCNDITLAKVTDPASTSPRIDYRRVTTSSMPNLTPTNNPVQAGFLGDYMWVAADERNRAHIVWADTRGREGAVEEDIYYARLP